MNSHFFFLEELHSLHKELENSSQSGAKAQTEELRDTVV